MPKSTPDLAGEWQRLLKEWEAAVSEYRTVAANGAAPSPSPEMEAAALRLAEVKRKMEGVIAIGKAERSTRDRAESLIVKMVDDLAVDPSGAPDKSDAGS